MKIAFHPFSVKKMIIKCRAELFSEYDLDDHSKNNHSCFTVFLNEPSHVSTVSSESGGKILCPVCNVKLGAWSWVGTECSCKCR